MNFRVYMIVETPILDKKYELLVPIDRRIYELINLLKKNIPELSENYYQNKEPYLYNKSTGKMYDMNLLIKDSDIKIGTRLVLI